MTSSVFTGAVRAGIAAAFALLLAGCVSGTGPERKAIELPIAGRAADRVPVAEPPP
jgi:hypothetical protein